MTSGHASSSRGSAAQARAQAARAVRQVSTQGVSLDDALPAVLPGVSTEHRGLVQALCFGVLRWYWRLEAVNRQLLSKPLRARDEDVHCLLLVGAYQLLYMRVPDHAAVHETVAAAAELGKPWAGKLINGVLRNLQRKAETLVATADRRDEVRLSHPSWLLARYRTDWPDRWQALAEGGNAQPPMTLRVNGRRLSCAEAERRLNAAGVEVERPPVPGCALTVTPPLEVDVLPGFAEGWVSVQDAAAQLAAPLLDLAPGQRVLDACAAPGGKTGHILEWEPALAEVVAVERDSRRSQRVADNLRRLGLNAQLIVGDAARPEQWWDGHAFHRILLDAPCSGTGVIRRHPDIKLLRHDQDIEPLARQQLALLRAVWPLLAPGGMLLYTTCSVLDEENVQVVAAFLREQREARERPLSTERGTARAHGRQLLPGEAGMDGFYYAGLEKD